MAVVILYAAVSFAQAPQRINYQAVARDNMGAVIVSSPVCFYLIVHDGTPGGTDIYHEYHTASTNQFGIVNLEIGGGTNIAGVFNNINWGSGNKYLEVKLDAACMSNYTSIGTPQLLSVPYALYANVSGNGGTPGPTGPTGPTGSGTGLPNGTVAGNTTYWNGTSWVVNSDNIFNNGANVGVGTPVPASKLEVKGTGVTNGTSGFNVTNSLGNSIFFVRDDGAIGIKKTNPGAELDINGMLRISEFNSGPGYAGFYLPTGSSQTLYALPMADGNSGQFLSTNGAGQLSWASGGGGGGGILSCTTTANSDYTIRGNGGGTYECTDALMVSSSGYVSVNTSPSSSYRFRVNGNTGIGSSPSSSYTLSVDGTGHFTDYVGIGTTPSSSYDLRVYGNVGIGSSPSSSYDLSVSGDSYITGGLGVGTTPNSSGLRVGSSSNFYVPTSMGNSSGTTLVVSGGTVYKLSSSRRYKDNIKDITYNKESIFKLRPVSYNYKSTGKPDVGLIAEEVDQVMPSLVIYEAKPMVGADGKPVIDKDGNIEYSKTDFIPEGVKYDRLSIYLLEIIKDHDKQLNEMRTIIDQQQKQIDQLLKK
ncbi:MAG: tail fiber domain-containing protein [Bacteroidota bacterium]